jgi:hypothetical protein
VHRSAQHLVLRVVCGRAVWVCGLASSASDRAVGLRTHCAPHVVHFGPVCARPHAPASASPPLACGHTPCNPAVVSAGFAPDRFAAARPGLPGFGRIQGGALAGRSFSSHAAA